MAPRTEPQYAALREQSRAKIISSALSLFARFGYEQTSVRMIAQDAGISQGLMYNYFASKEELLRAIFQQSMHDVQAAFAQGQGAGEAGQRLERLIRSSFDILRQHMAFWRLTYSVRSQPAVVTSLGADLFSRVDAIRHELEQHFRAIGADNPAIEAAILFALIDGVAQHYVLEPETYPLEAVVETIIAKYRSME